jgi:hypothetical protein
MPLSPDNYQERGAFFCSTSFAINRKRELPEPLLKELICAYSVVVKICDLTDNTANDPKVTYLSDQFNCLLSEEF